ncbi:N-acetyltransferase [Streptomyces sp. NBC_01318]|uniref:GNAT family N-acetyltransferase n=1 Tax=unclassified Streptomyces TaxID=2593676 RepID=UPI002E13F654|nr:MULTISPECIES: N-acetyltransferase [unclassified Streptomyces]WSJ52737.1 N-acetyltransferase [Streptomyces sp. NBC_01318]
MSKTDLQRIAAFRLSFAQRQAAVVTEVSGGVVVLDQKYAASYEHNQLVVEGAPAPSELPALAETALGHLRHRQITILDDNAGIVCAPALTAAGYAHATELIMKYSGSAAVPDSPAQSVALADLRPALVRQLRIWMPQAEDAVVRQLANRRTARLRGAEQVRFLAVRDENGTVGSWADVYLDAAQGIAQIEDVVTADTHVRRGYAQTILATALQHASDYDLVFLLADPDDWPHNWYIRRGFNPIGRFHIFTRTEAES